MLLGTFSRNYAALYFVIDLNDFFESLQHCDGLCEIDKTNNQFFEKKSAVEASECFVSKMVQKRQHLISHDLPVFFEAL